MRSLVCLMGAAVVLISLSSQNPAMAQRNQPRATGVDVTVGGGDSPLSAVTSNPGSANCSYGKVVMGNDGTVGFLVPVMGPDVLRGSEDLGNTTSWKVIPIDDVDPELVNSFSTCRTAQ